MTKKIKIDWDKYFRIAPVIPHEAIGDEKTGLIRIATSKTAFDKFLEATREKAIDRKTLQKFCEYQQVVFLDDEEFYNINPSYWDELGLVIQSETG